jgi:hypothetical protein
MFYFRQENGTQSDNVTRRGFKRNLSTDPYGYWPGGIVPYTIDTKYCKLKF